MLLVLAGVLLGSIGIVTVMLAFLEHPSGHGLVVRRWRLVIGLPVVFGGGILLHFVPRL